MKDGRASGEDGRIDSPEAFEVAFRLHFAPVYRFIAGQAYDSMFGLPAARIEIVTTLAGKASPWRAIGEEVGDLEKVHDVAPGATLRVVLMPSSFLRNATTTIANMLAGLRLAVSGTDVVSFSFSPGEHYFTAAQVAELHSILLGAVDRHVTVVASSGDKDIPHLGRRRQRLGAAVGRAHRAGRPVCPSRPWLHQPRHLPYRPQSQLPPGISRHYGR